MRPKSIPLFLFFLLVCAIPLFIHLDTMPMNLWDESRLAINAIEMLENGNWLVTHFDGVPDMWNTKPPLLIWVQVVFMKIFGANELALRLPSALAGFGTVLLVFFFCKKILNQERLGYIASLVLITISGYVTTHVTRTGDYDAFLVFWTTLSVFLIYIWANENEKKRKTKLLYFIALSFAFAVLTKGITGLMLLPGIVVFLFLEKKISSLFNTKHFYSSLLLFLFLTFGYYLLREQYNSGFLQAVWENELGGRYLSSLEGNGKEFSFYFRKMYEGRFAPWLYFIPLAVFLSFYENEKIKNCVKLLLGTSVFYLMIISFSKTKLVWYDAPVYPLMAVVVAIGIEKLLSSITHFFEGKKMNTSLLIGVFLISIFGQPYYHRFTESYSINKLWLLPEHLRYQEFFHQIDASNKFTILLPGYNASVLFYKKTLKDKEITIKQEFEFMNKKRNTFGEGVLDFYKKEQVMICETSVKRTFQKHYNYEVLKKWKSCELVVVKEEKNKSD